MSEDFWPLNTTLYVRDFKGNDPLFVSYFLRTLDLAQQNAAAAVPGLNRNVLHLLPVRIPSLLTQRRISAILSAYDDLIEVNLRRIAILEEMARRLYREWFVHLRFPGHEHVRMVDSAVGRVPEGWKIETLGQVSLNFDRFRKPLSGLQRQNHQGPYPYFGAAKVFDHIDDYIFDGDYLLVAEDGSVITDDHRPVLQMASGKFWANNHTHIVQGKPPVSTEFLYLRLREYDASACVTGAAQPKITQENLNRIPVVVPTVQMLDEFNNAARDMFSQQKLLDREIRLLRDSRDLLLPKLMSGELDTTHLSTQ
jgi:type I restriction enzyme S subunit